MLNSESRGKMDAHFRSGKAFAGLCMVVFAVMSLLGYLIWLGYREAINAAEITTRNYASIIDARLDATLRRVDADLQELVRVIPIAALDMNAVPRFERDLHSLLTDHVIRFPEVAGLRITDAHGDRLYTSDKPGTPRSQLSDRSYFRQLRDNPTTNLVFSEVIISRLGGKPSVVVARALRDERGVFRGTAFAVIELIHFQKLFQMLNIGAGGTVSVYRSDDFSNVVRWPPVDGKLNVPLPPDSPTRAALARGIKTATIETPSTVDGAVRIYSYHVLESYPFFVSVGLARDDVLASWQTRSITICLSSLLLAGLLIWLLHRLKSAEVELVRFNASLEQRVAERTAKLDAAIGDLKVEIVERKRTERALQSVNEELEAFAYSISHDLRTPLRGIAGISRILEEDYAAQIDAAGKEKLQRLKERTQKMGSLIEDLLKLSRLTRSDISVDKVDLSELARAAADELKRNEPRRNVTFEIPPVLEVRGDRRLLALMLENLLGNAWKFTSKKATARIQLGVIERDGKPAYFVSDDGAGFDMAYVENLFMPFQRLHGDSDFSGSGIGLAIVKRVVQRHGGRIWAEGETGKGATFYFTLSN